MEDKLGTRPETIRWSLNHGYENHKWDSGIRLPGETKEEPCKDPIYALLWAYANGFRRIVVLSAVGTGKTYSLARLGMHFLDCYPVPPDTGVKQESRGTRVFTFAPKENQLKIGIWKEVSSVIKRFIKVRPGTIKQNLDLYVNAKASEEERELWSMHGYAAGADADEESASRAQGIHDPHMLFLFEEATGIRAAVINAIRRTATGRHNQIIWVGNPNGQHDQLARAASHPLSLVIRISALDHPNIVLNDPDFIAGACTSESIKEILDEPSINGDKTAPQYLSRVRGFIPIASADCLFSQKGLRAVMRKFTQNGEGHNWTQPDEEYPDLYTKEWDTEEFEGRMTIFKLPVKEWVNRYLIFGDVAGDTARGDDHFAVVLDRHTQEIVAVIQAKGLGDIYGRILLKLCKLYTVDDASTGQKNIPWLGYETNGVGSLHRDPLIRKYKRIYKRVNTDSTKVKGKNLYGWYTSTSTRHDMIEALRKWGYQLKDKPWLMPDEEIFRQAAAFTKSRSGKYRAEDNHHDDAMLAIGGSLAYDEILTLQGKYPRKVTEPDKPAVDRRIRLKKAPARPGLGTPFDMVKMPDSFA